MNRKDWHVTQEGTVMNRKDWHYSRGNSNE